MHQLHPVHGPEKDLSNMPSRWGFGRIVESGVRGKGRSNDKSREWRAMSILRGQAGRSKASNCWQN